MFWAVYLEFATFSERNFEVGRLSRVGVLEVTFGAKNRTKNTKNHIFSPTEAIFVLYTYTCVRSMASIVDCEMSDCSRARRGH